MSYNIDASKVKCVTDQLKDNVATWGEDQGEEDIIIFSSFSFISFVSSPPRESQELLICVLQQPECSMNTVHLPSSACACDFCKCKCMFISCELSKTTQ